MLFSANLFAQDEKTSSESEIVMTKEELKSFLATIAEARRAQLKAKKDRAAKAYLNELRLKYNNTSASRSSGNISNERILEELRNLNQRINLMGGNDNDLFRSFMPRGSDNSTIIMPGNTSAPYMAPSQQGSTQIIPIRPKAKTDGEGQNTEELTALQSQIDSLIALKQAKLSDSIYKDSANMEMQGLKRQLDSLEMRIANTDNPEERQMLLEELMKKYKNFKKQIFFDNNSTEVKMAFAAQIQEIVQLLEKYPELSVMLEGWASPVGNAKYNKQLSMQRAESVEEVLVANGVAKNKIITAFRGEDTEAAEAEARRVDISVIVK